GVSTSQHLIDIRCCNSSGFLPVTDITAATGMANAASGTPIYMRVPGDFYPVDANGHVHEMFIASDGTWHVPDWTAASGAPAFVAGIPTTGYVDSSGTAHIIGVSPDLHIFDVRYNNGFLPVTEVSATYDSGTVSLALGGFTATACFGNSSNPACAGQPVNETTAQVASALAQAINVPSSPATATVSGSTISLAWKTPGPFT